MIQLDHEQVKPISRYSWKKLAKWLRTGLDMHFWPDEREKSRPFHPLDSCIGRGEDLTEDLLAIYNALPPTTQANFREAISWALAELPESSRHFKVFVELMYLGGAVRAYEILPVVESRVGKGFFGHPDMPEAREAFIAALDIVAGMAESGTKKQSLKCLQKLVNSRFFQHDYADMAFLALCHVDEDAFPAHLESLRDSFRKVLIEERIPRENLRDFARQFVKTVELPCIAEHIAEVELIGQQGDYWFVNALFKGNKAPLKLFEYEGKLEIRSRVNEKPKIEEVVFPDNHPTTRKDELRKFLPLLRKPDKPDDFQEWPEIYKDNYDSAIGFLDRKSDKKRPGKELRP